LDDALRQARLLRVDQVRKQVAVVELPHPLEDPFRRSARLDQLQHLVDRGLVDVEDLLQAQGEGVRGGPGVGSGHPPVAEDVGLVDPLDRVRIELGEQGLHLEVGTHADRHELTAVVPLRVVGSLKRLEVEWVDHEVHLLPSEDSADRDDPRCPRGDGLSQQEDEHILPRLARQEVSASFLR